MSTLRQDPTTKGWVIVAPRRAARPHFDVAFPLPEQPESDPTCPFCPGNEHMTPPEIHRLGDEESWRIRVVTNLYPALAGEGQVQLNGGGLFQEVDGLGRHEVIIESPLHNARLDEMPQGDVASVLFTWRERYRDLAGRTEAIFVFKNSGPMAGTSLAHPHSQVIATPVLPPDVVRRFAVARDYYRDTGRWLYDDLIRSERASGERLVAERGRMIAFVPFASSGPFETWVAPTFHQASFGDLEDADVADVAWLLRRVLAALRATNADPDFNLIVASAPAGEAAGNWFSWHLRIIPRLTTAAGFELGSGMSINPVPPEDAADALRAVIAAGAG